MHSSPSQQIKRIQVKKYTLTYEDSTTSPSMAPSKIQTVISTPLKALSGEVIIRQFRRSDAPQVYALLSEGFVHGDGSPQRAAQRRNRTSLSSCLAYAGIAVGLAFVVLSAKLKQSIDVITLQLAGEALSLCSAAFLIHVRKRIEGWLVKFCAKARETDMKDIAAWYGISPSGEQEGHSGFWVAVIEHPEDETSEVVGYVGLDFRPGEDPTNAELRRMIVSPRHRKRRIGSLLMSALLEHARRCGPPLRTIYLETIENKLQPGPLKLYESFGFRVVGKRVVNAAPFYDITILRLTMELKPL
ncbi:acyl-CoA N-acyltransferase [Mycena galericulata]|nr:acyl-CoA N-acyltransferase [Mycena galericulata]KAJ7455988.1 acyl-CoA N-acyltransferase [Mycena galericulata]